MPFIGLPIIIFVIVAMGYIWAAVPAAIVAVAQRRWDMLVLLVGCLGFVRWMLL